MSSTDQATLKNMGKWTILIQYEVMHNHNKNKANSNHVHILWDILHLFHETFRSSQCPVSNTELIHKSHSAPVPYPTMHHSEQKCAHFCSEWCIMGYGTTVLRVCEICLLPWLLHVNNEYKCEQQFYAGHNIISAVACTELCLKWSITF